MKENNTYRERCTYCGRFKDSNEDTCDCGKNIGYVVDNNDRGFYWGDEMQMNNIDNVLENKRVR